MQDPHAIHQAARAVGFHEVRIARVRPTPRADAFDRWVARGRHADMHWMPRGRDVRRDPRARAPWARSVLALGVLHHHRRPPDPGGRTGMVARYAWGRDYHNLMGKRLKKLRARLRDLGIRSWGGVDTAPILERPWAHAAGLGFTGKHTLQILAGSSSWLLLGMLFVDVALPPTEPARGGCGTCRRCLVACPTDAFPAPWTLDSRRCISYWTIEAKGLPPRSLRAGFGRWVFGCDVCQEVCPHNHAPPDPDEDDLRPRHAWLDLDRVLATPDAELLEQYRGTPLRRPGAAGLKRNALMVLANLGDEGAVDGIREHALEHNDPVVRAAAVWALHRLGATVRSADGHPLVQAEVRACDSA
ncbi:MAG: tRNA epoxyqueuosine(34) reductase QueG [Myxococcales bacterium]|nr:tRNA epoxyqueuosine(34) reductase QueG [Myxococcales bacterium]